VEARYGSFGYGHVDFFTAMADPSFTNTSEEAIFILKDVLENIVFSGLSLEERKSRIQQVLEQYMGFMNSLIDSLPKPESIESAKEIIENEVERKDQETIMTEDAKKLEVKDEGKDSKSATEFVTRAYFDTAIEKLETLITSNIERAKHKDTEKGNKPEKDKKGDSSIEDSLEVVTRAVEELSGRMDKLAEETVDRTKNVADETVNRTDDKGSPFKGMFSRTN
jgi:hypothetical protein